MKKAYIIFFLPFLLTSCNLFLSPFSIQSYQDFIELKVIHLKFIETFTENGKNKYDRNEIDKLYDIIDMKFREAIEYQAQITEDKTRQTAFEILREELKANYQALVDDEGFFSEPMAEELIILVTENYNLAIKGELSRRVSQ